MTDKAASADPWYWPVLAAWSLGKMAVSKASETQVSECEPEAPSRLICDFRKLTDHEIEDRELGG